MPIAKPLYRTSFSSGELDPALHNRPDITRYGNGCKKLENFLPQPTGGIKRRPHTVALASLPATDKVRLLRFEFSNDTTFAVLLIDRTGTTNIEVYDNDGTQVFSVATDYPVDGLAKVKYAQSYDVLFIVHPDVTPMRLERRADEWAFVAHNFNGGPYEPQNTDREKVVSLLALPWIPGTNYSKGDCVLDIPLALVWDDPLQSDIRRDTGDPYRVEPFTDPAKPLVTRRAYYRLFFYVEGHDQPTDGFVFFKEVTASAPPRGFVDLPFRIVSATEAGSPDRTFYTVECSLYREEDDAGTVQGDDQYVDAFLDHEQGLDPDPDVGRIQTFFAAQDLRDFDIYEARQDTTGQAVSDSLYWFRTGIYQGDVWATFETDPSFWDDWVEGEYFGFRETQENSLRGGFRFNGTIYGTTNSDNHEVRDAYEEGQASQTFHATGLITLETREGTWDARLRLQTSEDGGETWETIGVIESKANNNERIEREVYKANTLGRLYYDNAKSINFGGGGVPEPENPNTCLYTLRTESQNYVEGVFQSATNGIATLRITSPLSELVDTFKWSKRAFSEQNGYPGAVTIFEERLTFAGVPNSPNTLYLSEIDDFEEWGDGTFETSPLQFTIASSTFNEIVSLQSQRNLSIFTVSEEFSIGSRNSQEALSGTTVSARKHSRYGSSDIASVMMQELVVYIERDGKTVMGMTATDEFAPFASAPLTAFADHIAGADGFKELTVARSPENYTLCLREDGQIACLIYDRTQEVNGWSRLIVGDGVVTHTVVAAPRQDRVYLVVDRGGEHFLERMDLNGNQWLDHYKAYVPAVKDAVVSLEYAYDADPVLYEGLLKLTEGADYTRSGADITFLRDVDDWRVGFEYQHQVETTDFEIFPSGKGGIARIIGFDLYHDVASGGEFRYSDDEAWQDIPWHPVSVDVIDLLDNAEPLKTVVDIGSASEDSVGIHLRGSLPHNFELFAIGVNGKRQP